MTQLTVCNWWICHHNVDRTYELVKVSNECVNVRKFNEIMLKKDIVRVSTAPRNSWIGRHHETITIDH